MQSIQPQKVATKKAYDFTLKTALPYRPGLSFAPLINAVYKSGVPITGVKSLMCGAANADAYLYISTSAEGQSRIAAESKCMPKLRRAIVESVNVL
jgi:hypothetical protein